MFHDHVSNLDASRQQLIGESRTFPNPGFERLLEDVGRDDLIWLDGALTDQLDGLPHYVPDAERRRELFVQISDRLALVRQYGELRKSSDRRLLKHARLWTFASVALFAGAAMAGTMVVGG